MNAKTIIRDTVDRVTALRQRAANQPGLAQAVSEIKHIQARRFQATYADLLQSASYRPAALFFLNELYSDKDYSARDAQFSRIAGALERVFPPQVVQTAVSLAELHGLTEDLDLAMAEHWLNNRGASESARYLSAWRAVARRADRNTQLATTLAVGEELDQLTRKHGLRMMLRMMRGPANLAGLGSLQQFLEFGFDTFAAMARTSSGTLHFLNTVETRETLLIDRLFNANTKDGEAEITQLLGQP